MQKLVTIIGAMLLLAGVAAAGTFASLGSGSDDNPTISAEPLPATTTRQDEARREDRREDRAAEARGRENEPGEDARGSEVELRGRDNEPRKDVRGREAEPNDDRGGVTTVQDDHRDADDNSGAGSSSSGHGGSVDSGSGRGGHGGDKSYRQPSLTSAIVNVNFASA